MNRFSRLAWFFFTLSTLLEFRDVDGHFYTRQWSLLEPMTYTEWLDWHFDPPDGEINPLVDDDFYEDDEEDYEEETYVEKTGPPRSSTANTDDGQLADRFSVDERLETIDRKIRDLAALSGVYVLPTPPEKA